MLRVLARRGWVIALTTVTAGVIAYAVASTRTASYTAEGIAVVTESVTRTPIEANQLAVTDAVLVPKDAVIARTLARALGTTTKEVRDRLTVFNDPDTAILRINYRAHSARDAMRGVSLVLDGISGKHPITKNIAPGSVGIVRLPLVPSAARGTGTLVAIGVILGLALGALLLVAWERMDPRIDEVHDAEDAVGSPVAALEGISVASAAALLGRWRELAERSPATVALVPVTADLEPVVPELADLLATAGDGTVNVVRGGARTGNGTASSAAHGRSTGTLSLVVAGVPGGGFAGEAVARASDLAVLVVERGTARADLLATLDVLRRFDITPAWTILVGRGSLGRRRRRAPVSATAKRPPTPVG